VWEGATMDINEIKSFLEGNKESDEVKTLIKAFTPSFEKAMEDDSFQKNMKSYTDSQISKAVEAYKEKGFKSAVESEVMKRLEAKEKKDPMQIKFEEMERKQNELLEKLAEKERAELRAQNKATALQALSERKLPTDVLDFFVTDEQEKTQENIEIFAGMMESYTQSLKQDSLKNNNVKVPGSGTEGGNHKNVPGENASQSEWEAYFKSQK
jgi:hypothetical protein